jgi:hypothetical protein
LTPAHHLDQLVPVPTHLQHFAGHIHAHLGDHPQDVALGFWGGRPDNEVRPAQSVKVRSVIGGKKDAIEQFAELLGRRRRIDVKDRIQGLGSGHVMGFGAHATDTAGQIGHLLGRPAHAELLEPAQFRDLQIGVGHVSLAR